MVISLDHLQALRQPTKYLMDVWVEEALIYFLTTIEIPIHQGTDKRQGMSGSQETSTSWGTSTSRGTRPIWVANKNDLKVSKVKDRLRGEMASLNPDLLFPPVKADYRSIFCRQRPLERCFSLSTPPVPRPLTSYPCCLLDWCCFLGDYRLILRG